MIVLTGASGGIGLEIIEELSKLDDILAIYNTSKPKDVALKNVTFHKVDISDPDEIKNFIDQESSNLKDVTLINLAAVSIDGLLANYGIDDWEEVMSINLSSNFLFSRYLIPIMIKDKWGRIIHVSSTNSAISGLDPEVTFLICVTVCSLSPGLIRSGEYPQKKSLLYSKPLIFSKTGTQSSSVHPG